MHKIAHDLNDLINQYDKVPFIFGVAKISMLGVSDLSKRDYFILRIKKGTPTKRYGNAEIMDVSDRAKRQFLSSLDLFEVVYDSQEGKIYELKGKAGRFKIKNKHNKQKIWNNL